MTIERIFKPPTADQYPYPKPLPDPQKIIDMNQEPNLTIARYMLKDRFSDRDDVLVSGDGYLCFDTSTMREDGWLVPDCVVAFAVSPQPIFDRNGYVINEVGKSPEFVLEVASESTGINDYTSKLASYARLGVTETWLFDATGGKFHDAPMSGHRLVARQSTRTGVGGTYAPVPLREDADGVIRGHCEVLGLYICWDDGRLRFWDPMTGEYLSNLTETRNTLTETRTALAETRNTLAKAEAGRDEERAARIAAEAEADRLREQLRRLQ